MADEDYGDDDGAFYFDDDDEYLYVEDDYDLADELAETQIPDPGYTEAWDEIAMDSFEHDMYEYFGELEYGSDSYWDAGIKHLRSQSGESRLGSKRGASGLAEEEERLAKKRRVGDVRDNVVFLPFEARCAPLPPLVERQGGFALLPDWKERFPERGSPAGKGRAMPEDMKRAAEGEDDVEEDEDGEGEEIDEDMEEEEGEGDAGGVDHGVIMQVLRQKLADSGLGDVDESVFQDAIAKMLSGDSDGDEAVGGLASLLLGQKGGSGEAFQGFLAKQGVEMGDADEDEEEGEDEQDDSPSKPSTSTSKPVTDRTPQKSTSEKTKPRASKRITRTNPGSAPVPPPASASALASPPPPPPSSNPPTKSTTTTNPARKRNRAPSVSEQQPTPPTSQLETSSESTAKPSAKRRRTPQPTTAAAAPAPAQAQASAPAPASAPQATAASERPMRNTRSLRERK